MPAQLSASGKVRCKIYQVGDIAVLFIHGTFDGSELDDRGKYKKTSEPSIVLRTHNLYVYLSNDESITTRKYTKDLAYDSNGIPSISDSSSVTSDASNTYFSNADMNYFSMKVHINHDSDVDPYVHVHVDNSYTNTDDFAMLSIMDFSDIVDSLNLTDSDLSYYYVTEDYGQELYFEVKEVTSDSDYDTLIDDIEDYFSGDGLDAIEGSLSDAYSDE
ncbi:hypothetical protein [Rubellicoccus peritrichatus]|uniref:Uncharacterized protein n=1 Tax=Rubellicoccus peritrichatus TaxID=3080537 RepID=A0AAQ3LC39_9BACT|nr:hypothetical protein [Puniceicoccus sp. CR14]WOO43364.1 hypothetical protein RZN69_09715 [Puniceicoccus sp. CR14]